MQPILLIDIGSTFTKVVAVDVDDPRILGRAAAHTTVESNVSHGLQHALDALEQQTGRLVFHKRLACSSAAGGLKMIACGLAPSLTHQAAKTACLGAGAKVIRSFSHKLTEEDIDEILGLAPDILLLAGGTDGGNETTVIHNAEMLSAAACRFPIVFAGNRNAKRTCLDRLSHLETHAVDNILPRLDTVNADHAGAKIREIFLARIIHAKGLTDVAKTLDAPLIPTPAAMLQAMTLLAGDIGDLVAVDLGGATTDVYSLADGAPTGADVLQRGLPEPFAKRTVEGDIGMRYSAQGILDAVGADVLAQHAGLSADVVVQMIQRVAKNPDMLPNTADAQALDRALAACAVFTAVSRHAGRIETVYTPTGPVFVQTGKDLTAAKHLLLTGGAIIHHAWAAEIAAHALFDATAPEALRPKAPRIHIDRQYILPTMGLLGEVCPDAALAIMRQTMVK